MRYIISSLLLLNICSLQSIGQVRYAGTPFTLHAAYSNIFASATYVPQSSYAGPDISKLHREDLSIPHTPFDNVRIGASVPANISFPSSGIFTVLDDGRQVWRAQIKVPGGLALGLYYDKFNLPAGVSYYLSNANGKQILGAYTSQNNPDDGLWATEKVQGELINMEVDIEPGVDVSKISMHINTVASFYKSLSYLQPYTPDPSASTLFMYGTSSPCEINAVCPIGITYPN
jgi:lysyl endopeptidase